MMKSFTFILALVFLLICSCKKDEDNTPPQVGSAAYEVTFNASWSAQTHPLDFPSNPHFSGLIGMTHNRNVKLFEAGSIATEGIKEMAETGGKGKLEQEILSIINKKTAQNLISEGGIGNSPGKISFDVKIDASHSLLSIVSMVAPSPDWFIAVKNLDLFADNKWTDSITVDVALYDAGTDAGISYTAANEPEDPWKPIEHMPSLPPVLSSITEPLGSISFVKVED